MTLEIGLLFLLLGGMVYLFLTEKIPVDLTAFAGLVLLILMGYVTKDEAFTGFSSSAVITMLSIFIVSAALLQTGIADLIGGRLHALVGGKEIPLILTLMIVAGVLSAFMNNIAATAVLMPAVASLARHAGISPSRLFMPLAFGAILGGTTTMVGTPPNILAASMLEERGLEPFGLFDFTPLGLLILGIGSVFMITLGRRLLPTRDAVGEAASEVKDLAKLYQLQEQTFAIQIPKGSVLDGQTLGESRLGSALGVQVVAIERKGKRRLAPRADNRLHEGDTLLVKGQRQDVQSLVQVTDLEVQELQEETLPRPIRGVGGIRLALPDGSSMVGKNLRELGFRGRYGVVVVGIVRGDETLLDDLANELLRADDEILAIGERPHLETLVGDPEIDVREIGLSAVQDLQSRLFLLKVPDTSRLVGSTMGESRIGELVGLTVSGVIRGGQTLLAIPPDEVIQPHDKLIVVGEKERVTDLYELGTVDLVAPGSDEAEDYLESEDVGVVEAAVAPRSRLVGKTLGELSFRQRYGLQTLAVWREGHPLHTGLAELALRFGDALLLQGSRRRIRLLAKDPDFVVLTPTQPERRADKALYAIGGLLLMVGLVVSGYQPIHVAAFTAATLVVLSGAITMDEAYRAIEWRAIFLVAAVLPVGAAMERTGAAQLLADTVTSFAGPLGPYAVLAGLVVLSSLLSQGLDGAPAVVLLTPVVLQTAESLQLSPYPLMMGVSLAASAAFMTPFSHKANLLVMGAGGYRAMDYVRVGTPLTILLLALMVFLVPVFFPF